MCVAPTLRAAVYRSPIAVGPPTEADMVGTWTGTVQLHQVEDTMDGGVIVIARDSERLTASVGPNARVRFRASRLTRTDRGLKFEVKMPDEDVTRLLVYDVAFVNGAMTGTVTFVRHGLTAPAQIAFTRG